MQTESGAEAWKQGIRINGLFGFLRSVQMAGRAAAQAAGLRLLYHIFKLTLRALLAFTKKHGIYAARLMFRLRLAFTNRTYYTMTP